MSNATEHSQSSGNNNNRRRRSRGGKNRNGQQNRHDNRNDNRHGGDHRHGGGSQRSEEFRPQGPRPPRHAPLPPKLSFFQKILKAVGLYKAPAAPARPPQQPAQAQAKSGQGESRPPKSNTRNARSDGGGKPAAERQPQGQQPSGKRERAPRGDKPRGGDGSSVESPRVYVGNLSYDVTEQDLQELFKGIGPVRSVEIVYNRSTHRSKGYGFVEMLHKDEAVRTVEVLHDQPFMGRKLIVSGAKSKGQDEREDQEEDRPQGKVTLAPLPPAETVQPIAEPPAPAVVAEAAEPVIETIVETVAAEPTESAEPETKPEIA
jgi:hypothetical protein